MPQMTLSLKGLRIPVHRGLLPHSTQELMLVQVLVGCRCWLMEPILLEVEVGLADSKVEKLPETMAPRDSSDIPGLGIAIVPEVVPAAPRDCLDTPG